MPHVTVNRPDVSLEDAAQALRHELGDRHTVSLDGSGHQLKVSSSTLSYVNVHMKRVGTGSGSRVHGVGIGIGRIVNELTPACKVAGALRRGLTVAI